MSNQEKIALKEITEYLAEKIQCNCKHITIISEVKEVYSDDYYFSVESYTAPARKGFYKIECYFLNLEYTKEFVFKVDASKFDKGDLEMSSYFSMRINKKTKIEDIKRFIDKSIEKSVFFNGAEFLEALEKQRLSLIENFKYSIRSLRFLEKDDYYPLLESLSPFCDSKQIKYICEYVELLKSKDAEINQLEKKLLEKGVTK